MSEPCGVVACRGAAPRAAWIGNAPVLAHTVRWMRRAGLEEVAVLWCGEGRAAAPALWPPGTEVLAGLDDDADVGAIAAAAAAYAAGGPVLLQLGCGLPRYDARALFAAQAREDLDVLLLADAPAELPPGVAALRGVDAQACVLDARALELLRGGPPAARLCDLSNRVAAAGGRVRYEPVDPWWRETGRADDLLEGNRLVLDELSTRWSAAQLDRSEVQGRVAIHPTARLVSTVVRGPAIVGADVRLAGAYVGPYTALGEGVVLENAEVENSIVLPGARIQNLGGRMEGSLIGRRAVISRDFALPTAMRFRTGDDAELSLA